MKKSIYLISGVFTFLIVSCKKTESNFEPRLQNPQYKIDKEHFNKQLAQNGDSVSLEYSQSVTSGLFSSSNQRIYVINYFVNSDDEYTEDEFEKIAKDLNELTKENLVNIKEFDAVEIKFKNSKNEIFKEVDFKTEI